MQRRRLLDHGRGDSDRRRLERAIDFAPTAAALAAATAELEAAGSGGAVDAARRERALRAFARFPAVKTPFGRLDWASGRVRVTTPPRVAPRAASADPSDVPALAVENAGGLVHSGSIYLDAPAGTSHGVTLASLADARRRDPAGVDAVHLRVIAPETDRYTALATAFQNCGVFIDVPAGVALEAPLQLLWLGAPGEPAAVFPHTVLRIGAHARVTVVERILGGTDAFVAGIVEAELGPGARLDYVAIQEADDGARVFVRRRARCAAGALVAWHLADLGGAIVGAACGAILAGTGAGAETNALFFARGFTRAAYAVDVDHDAARVTSRTTVRCAVTDRARGRFGGSLRFSGAAAGSVATVRDDGLILSHDARLTAAPVLAVPTRNVAASQSSSIGSLDEDELFYVQSRGISRALAERMIALAFFEPAIARFPSDALRDEVRTALDERLDAVPDTFD